MKQLSSQADASFLQEGYALSRRSTRHHILRPYDLAPRPTMAAARSSSSGSESTWLRLHGGSGGRLDLVDSASHWWDPWWDLVHYLERGLDGPEHADVPEWVSALPVVQFPLEVWLVMGAMCLFVVVHEFYVGLCGTPILVLPAPYESCGIQLTHMMCMSLGYIQASMILPLSLDYALVMGVSAILSVLTLPFGAIAGFAFAKALIPDSDWNPYRARLVSIAAGLGSGLLGGALAAVSNTTVSWSMEQKRVVFWLVQLSFQVLAFLAGMNMMPIVSLQNRATRVADKTFWAVVQSAAKNGGMVLGPALLVLLHVLVSADGSVLHPQCRMAWAQLTSYGFLALLVPLTTSLCCAVNTKEVDWVANDPVHILGSGTSTDCLEVDVREKLQWTAVTLCFERPYIIAAMEAATVMMLELISSWPAFETAISFVCIAFGGGLCVLLSMLLLWKDLVSERTMLLSGMWLSLFSCVLLFDITGAGMWSLLVADALLFGCSAVSMGVAEGWAARAAVPCTGASFETFRLRYLIVSIAARFFAPVATRFILVMFGRNIYASMQLIMVALGLGSAVRLVLLVGPSCPEYEPEIEPAMAEDDMLVVKQAEM